MQVSIPCVLFAASPSQLILRGGTNAEMAPQIDYTLQVRASMVLGKLAVCTFLRIVFYLIVIEILLICIFATF